MGVWEVIYLHRIDGLMRAILSAGAQVETALDVLRCVSRLELVSNDARHEVA